MKTSVRVDSPSISKTNLSVNGQKIPTRSDDRVGKNLVFDTPAEVKEAVKTSNSPLSAYMDTVKGELRSKSKRLAKQGITNFQKTANGNFCNDQKTEPTKCQKLVLTIGGFC